MKPILRWTIGGTTNNGYKCLSLSIRTMLKLYKDTFDYYVCYNNSNVQQLREIISNKPITIIKQTWDDCPLPIDFLKNKGTSLWKFCPSRLDINRHEIIMDNDIVIVKNVDEIDQFLSQSDVALLVEDPIKYQGEYKYFFISDKYNAGFIGLPPKYDLAQDLYSTWLENGSNPIVNQQDEQGLATATIKKNKFIKIAKEKFALVKDEGIVDCAVFNKLTNKNNHQYASVNFFADNFYAYHFVGSNKKNTHKHFDLFEKEFKKKMII